MPQDQTDFYSYNCRVRRPVGWRNTISTALTKAITETASRRPNGGVTAKEKK
jgi:hypothetical protein